MMAELYANKTGYNKGKGGSMHLAARHPTLGEGAYYATTAAILGFIRVPALELGPYYINVNAILPGFTVTEITREVYLDEPGIEQKFSDKTALKRPGKPHDQAAVVVFLDSELSDHIMGEAIVVPGGRLMIQ